jgi:hypothetical protein
VRPAGRHTRDFQARNAQTQTEKEERLNSSSFDPHAGVVARVGEPFRSRDRGLQIIHEPSLLIGSCPLDSLQFNDDLPIAPIPCPTVPSVVQGLLLGQSIRVLSRPHSPAPAAPRSAY